MNERFLAFCKPYLDRLMALARKDTDVSYDEYKELQTKYKDLYK